MELLHFVIGGLNIQPADVLAGPSDQLMHRFVITIDVGTLTYRAKQISAACPK
jgi:hypothetical protein